MKSVRNYIYLVPILCLVVVAAVQIVLAGQGLSAWKGGGFGMYAVNELRYLRVYSSSGNDWLPVDVSSLRQAAVVLSMPNKHHVLNLSTTICTELLAEKIKIEVWEGDFSSTLARLAFSPTITSVLDCA
jgi:hypothetical protein